MKGKKQIEENKQKVIKYLNIYNPNPIQSDAQYKEENIR